MQDTANPRVATFCMGRFLIDVPEGSSLIGGSYKYGFFQVERVVFQTFEEFEKNVDAKEKELRAMKHEKESSLLRKVTRPEIGARVMAFRKQDFTTRMVKVEGYRWVDGASVLLDIDASTEKQGVAMAAVARYLSSFRPRLEIEIPNEPGYCFKSGFIASEDWENEEAGVDIDLPDHPDVVLSIDIFPLASHKHDTPLLDRVGGVLQGLGNLASGVQVLRKGERQIGPYKGQEYLVSTPGSGGSRAHSFIWETQGEGTLDTPFISIEFSSGRQDANGNPQPTRLTNAQALQLWDRIVSSFRLRPTGGTATTSDARPPRTPLGTELVTGRSCPQAGWWECDEA